MAATCISCGSPAKFREINSTTRLFCNAECQLISHFSENFDLTNSGDNIRFLETVKYGDNAALQALLADKNVQIAFGNKLLVSKALQLAIEEDNVEKVETLLSDARITSPPAESFEYAVIENNMDMVELFFQHRHQYPEEFYFRLFLYLIQNGTTDMTMFFLESGRFDPSANENEALRIAVERSAKPIIAALLQDARVDPTVNRNEVLRMAIDNDRQDIVKMLLQSNRVKASAFDNNALQLAVANENAAMVVMLLPYISSTSDESYDYAIRVAGLTRNAKIKLLLEDYKAKKTLGLKRRKK